MGTESFYYIKAGRIALTSAAKAVNIVCFQNQWRTLQARPIGLMVPSPAVATFAAHSRLLPRWAAAFLQLLAFAFLQMPQLSDLWAEKKGSVYNVLWILVFGFATLNILGLVLRRFDPRKSGLNFGEILAITVMFVSVFLLGLEMLGVFHIFPVKLPPR